MESMNIGPVDPPTVAQEKADRLAQMHQLAALFEAAPWQEIEPDVLRAITPHYQQRISEMRRQLGMVILNMPRTRQDASGATHRADGAYRYRPTGEPQGRDAGTFTAYREWLTEHPAPFTPPFELT